MIFFFIFLQIRTKALSPKLLWNGNLQRMIVWKTPAYGDLKSFPHLQNVLEATKTSEKETKLKKWAAFNQLGGGVIIETVVT